MFWEGWPTLKGVIDDSHAMHVVEGGVAVHDVQGLIDLDAEHVGIVHTALLEQGNRRSWCRITSGAVLDVDEHVSQITVRIGYDRLILARGGVLGLADRVRVVGDDGGDRSLAGQGHLASDAGRSHGPGGSRGSRASPSACRCLTEIILIVAVSAARGDQQTR